jgi:hypothetical protein
LIFFKLTKEQLRVWRGPRLVRKDWSGQLVAAALGGWHDVVGATGTLRRKSEGPPHGGPVITL